ncbi:MAG: glycosyltransferase [Myxococcaceae bacterium]
MNTLSLVFSGLGGLLFVLILLGHRQLARAIQRPPIPSPRLQQYPPVTVIRPIRGLDIGSRENAMALLDQAYPGELEILFILDTESDPAYPVMVELVQGRRASASRHAEVLLAGRPPSGRTGKLNAMVLGEARAKGELIAFSDSDTRPGPHLVRVLVEELLARPEAGDTFAPIIAQSDETQAADVAYELLVNPWYSASVALAAGSRGELPFIMGQMMVFTRAALAAVGGVHCAEGQFVDDMYIGQCIARAGFKNVMVPYPLRVVTGGLGPRQFIRVFRRWMLFSQAGLPAHFVRPNWVRGILYFSALGATGAALAAGALAGAVLPAAAGALFVWSQVDLQERLGGPKVALKHLWVPVVLPIVAALVTLSTKLNREVDWRGRSYSLDASAKLTSGGGA